MEIVTVLEITVVSVRLVFQLLTALKEFVDQNPQIKVYVRRILNSVKQQLDWTQKGVYQPTASQRFWYETQYVDFLPHMTVVPHRKSGGALRKRFLDGRYLMDASKQVVGWQSQEEAERDDAEVCVVDMPVYDWKFRSHKDPLVVLHRTDVSGEVVMPHFAPK